METVLDMADECISESAATVQLCDLYENDCIFDKFNCCVSGSGSQIATGTYNNQLKLIQQEGTWPARHETNLEATRDPMKKRQTTAKVLHQCLMLSSNVMIYFPTKGGLGHTGKLQVVLSNTNMPFMHAVFVMVNLPPNFCSGVSNPIPLDQHSLLK